MKRRIAGHKRAPWRGDVTRWALEDHPDIEAAQAAETAAIWAESPEWNDHGADHTRCEHPRCVRERADAAARIRETVAGWPPLSAERRERLTALLHDTDAA